MSFVPIKGADNAVRNVDTFTRTEGADTVHTQATALVNPADGTPILPANQTTAEAIRDRLPATLGTKAAAASLPVVSATGTLTNASGTIAAGGTAQQLVGANAARRGLTLQNTSAGDLRVSPWGTASVTAGYRVGAGQLLVLDAPHCGVGAVSVWGAETDQTFVAAEAV